ncbi:hypothetical protein DS831_05075 [Bombilactobacillus bombi]|uniref:Uncharacterized protein n=1 Tax=Bombilactobacillus bombi TaxID=1303590 RepID=A0A3R6XU81_9LACO|nr:hypothetical protein [Bombilactobacillus bombi]RHW49547.1 hypothetical protein DS831_05075 [Bombilactobacillus bombi]
MKAIRLMLSTLISFLSVITYPLVLTQKYPYHFDNGTKLAFIMVALIIIYIEFFIPLHPNNYFNGVYSLVSFLIILKNYSNQFSLYLLMLFICQLLIAFIANSFEKSRPLLCIFVIPIFSTFLLIYSLFHFASANAIVTTILINILVTMIALSKSFKEQLLASICIIFALGSLYFFHYLSIIKFFIYLAIFIASLFLTKYLKNKFLNDKYPTLRILLSLISILP